MKQKIYLNGNINIFSVFTSNSESGRPGAGSKLSNLKDYFKSVKYTQFMIFSPIFMKILSNYQKSLFTDTCNMLYVSKQHLLLKFNNFIFYRKNMIFLFQYLFFSGLYFESEVLKKMYILNPRILEEIMYFEH